MDDCLLSFVLEAVKRLTRQYDRLGHDLLQQNDAVSSGILKWKKKQPYIRITMTALR